MRRTLEDWQKHSNRALTCGESYGVLSQVRRNVRFLVPVKYSCHSRTCEHCQKARRNNILEKMQYFKSVRRCVKLELTFPDSSPDPLEHPDFYSHAWEIFLKRIRRRIKKFRYFRMIELTKAGIPHFHILLDCYIPHWWISEIFPDCGGGEVNWIKQVPAGHALGYVTKYVTKSTGENDDYQKFFYQSGMRCFSYSHKLFEFVPRNNTYYVANKGKICNLDHFQAVWEDENGSYLFPLPRENIDDPPTWIIDEDYYDPDTGEVRPDHSPTRQELRDSRFCDPALFCTGKYFVRQ